jgi:hypothetical protein
MKFTPPLALVLVLRGVGLALFGAWGCAHVSIETVDPPEGGSSTPEDSGRQNACADCPECAAERAACQEVPLCRASAECTSAHNCYALPQREFFVCATQCALEVGIMTFDDPASVLGYAHYQCLVNSSCRAACFGDQ